MSQPIPVDSNVKVGKLANGLTYYIRKNAQPAKKVELRLAINAGSVLEERDQRGLAHFMEHMGFNGSKNFPKNELVNFLQKAGVKFGADLNAYTGFDETVYILPIPSGDPKMVEKGFTVLEDWAFNNLLDPKEIEKERGVVLEESRLSKGSQERLSRQYFPLLFNGSQYAQRLPIGNDSVLKTFKPATLKSFYKQWYRPNLMAVIVVGDIDPVLAEKQIKAHFGKFTNPVGAKQRPAIIPIPSRTKPEALVLTDEEETNTVLQIFNYVAPAKKVVTWGDYRETVIDGLVSSLINQRLQELTQKENPPFIYAATNMGAFLRGYQAFTSFAVLGDNTAEEAVDALVSETERARQFGFLSTELERAKAGLLNGAQTALNEKNKAESGGIVGQYVAHFLQGAPIPGAENRYAFLKEALPAISLADINTALKNMPANSNAFALITAPEKMKTRLPDNETLSKLVAAATGKTVTAYEEKAIASQLLDKEPTPGKIIKETKNEKLGTTDLTLSNGVTVTLKPTTFKNDEIIMDAWRWGGIHRFDIADKMNAQSATQAVQEMGVKDMSSTELRKFLAGKTVSVTPYMNPHEEGIEGRSSVKDFETFLQLNYLYFTQPKKDEAAFNSMVKKGRASLQYIKQNPQVFYQDTLNKIVYGNNPWMTQIPDESDYDKMNLDKALSIYNQVFSNANGMHFTFVGNLDPATVKPLLEKYLGSLPASPAEHKYKDNNVRPKKGNMQVAIKKGKEAQSYITLLFNGETEYNREESMALKALLEVLNIRVTEKLREEMGGIYGGGFFGAVVKRPYTHYSISASVPCGPENVDKLSAALIDLIKTAQKGIEQKDLDKVKQTWKKQYETGVQSNNFWLDGLSSAWINRDDPEGLLTYKTRVDALTPADLQKAAKKFLDLNNYVKAVLYPEVANTAAPAKPIKTF
jgi:zinc protease